MTHQVLVLGAGYAGLPAAQRLARQVYADEVSVRLVSASSSFVERPRLHQVAAGQDVTAIPLDDYLARSSVDLVTGGVQGIDLTARTVALETTCGSTVLEYDTLVYALGSNIDTRTVPGSGEHALALTGWTAAHEVRRRVAEVVRDRGRLVVCGGGLTGLEVAAEFAESHPALDVQLVSRATPGGWLSDQGRRYLDRVLDDLGVDVVSGRSVARVDAAGLVLDDGTALPADVAIWAGGFAVPSLAGSSGLAVDSAGRAVVDPTLRSVSHPDVYVIGDAAAVPGAWGDALAMGCRTGGLTGPRVADVLAARLGGRSARDFRYRYVHECISLGRRRGLVQFLHADETPAKRVLTGRLALHYKNATLNGARLLFRWPGPYLARRRHLTAPRSGSLAAS